MHALLVCVGTYGNMLPFAGLGKALRARGHAVTLFGSGYIQDLAKREDLGFVGLDDPEDFRDVGPDGTPPTRGRRFLRMLRDRALRQTPRVFRFLEKWCSVGESIVIAPPWLFGARLAAERLGVPLASVLLQPLLLGSAYDVPPWRRWSRRLLVRLVSRIVNRRLAPGLNAFRAQIGLPPLTQSVWKWSLSPELVLGFFPEWLSPPRPDWPAQTLLAGFPLYDALDDGRAAAEVEAFIQAGEPPLVFSQASQVDDAPHYFAASVEVARRLGRRAILLTPHRQQLPSSLPPDVRHFKFAPLSLLLPRAAAIVHHGGMGTLAQALAAGVPQLTVPGLLDQFDNSRRLLTLGVSANLSARSYGSRRAARLLAQLVASPDVARNCQTYALRCRQEIAFEKACAAVEHLHQRHR